MKKNGFNIEKIIIKGKYKEDAKLVFKEGLNVISGPSDTGKTYLFDVINYMLGSDEKLRDIEESEGYDEIFMEIYSNNKYYTLKRIIKDKNKDLVLYESSYENLSKCNPKPLASRHNEDNEENISKFYMNLCGSNYKKVIVNKDGKGENFTFRDYAKIMLLNEEKIISKQPVFLAGTNNMRKTRYVNTFKTILTGIEDKVAVCNKDKNKDERLKLTSKIELLENLIISYSNDIKEIASGEVEQEELESKIYEKNQSIKLRTENISCNEEKVKLLRTEQSEIDQKITYYTNMIDKFLLLEINYKSDLERIDFIEETNFYLNQLNDVKCPFCYSEINDIELTSNIEFSKAIYTECQKLKKKLRDLKIMKVN